MLPRKTSAEPGSISAALAFLVFASTLLGYAVFLVLARAASPILANSFNYVSPVIALVLAALFLDENVGWAKLARPASNLRV